MDECIGEVWKTEETETETEVKGLNAIMNTLCSSVRFSCRVR